MKIPNDPQKPPIQPDATPPNPGKQAGKQNILRPDHGKSTDQRAKAFSSGLSKLMSGSPSDFESPGIQTLLATVKMAQKESSGDKNMATQMQETKIEAMKNKKDQAAAKHQAERTLAWTNVGISLTTATGSVVTGAARAGLDSTAAHLKAGGYGKGTDAWQKAVGAAGDADLNKLIQDTLRQAYVESLEDLQFYADKIRYFNELKTGLRDEISKARIDFSDAIHGMEEKLSTVSDDAQLANVDLQSMLQKTQQTLQLMSNVAKMLHDTGMSMIRKIG